MCSFSGETDHLKCLLFEMLAEVVTDRLRGEPNLNVGFLEDKLSGSRMIPSFRHR